MKNKNLISKVFTILFSGLFLIPLFVNFFTITNKFGSTSTSTGVKLGDVIEEMGNLVNASKVLFYITFALAMLLLVLTIVSMLISNKTLNTCIKVVSLIVMLMAIATFITLLIWGIDNSSSSDIIKTSTTVIPWAGGILTLLFGVMAGIAGLASAKKKKRK